MKKTMRKIAEIIAKVYMEMLTNGVIIIVTALIIDFGWAEDWWDSVGGGWDSIAVGILMAAVYQVIRYQTNKKINDYLNRVNPKVDKDKVA